MAKTKGTPKQEAFALEYILNGKDATKAYTEVYDVKTDNKGTIWKGAYDVKNNPKVATMIHELEMAQFDSAILTIEDRKKILSQLGKAGDIKSIDLLNKMESVYIEKREIAMSGEIEVTKLPAKEEN